MAARRGARVPFPCPHSLPAPSNWRLIVPYSRFPITGGPSLDQRKIKGIRQQNEGIEQDRDLTARQPTVETSTAQPTNKVEQTRRPRDTPPKPAGRLGKRESSPRARRLPPMCVCLTVLSAAPSIPFPCSPGYSALFPAAASRTPAQLHAFPPPPRYRPVCLFCRPLRRIAPLLYPLPSQFHNAPTLT